MFSVSCANGSRYACGVWAVDAATAALTSHAPAIKGFALGDTLDVTNLAHGATASFKRSTEVLTVTQGKTSFKLQFDSAFKGDTFQLTAAGAGTDISLKVATAAESSDRFGFGKTGPGPKASSGRERLPTANAGHGAAALDTPAHCGGHIPRRQQYEGVPRMILRDDQRSGSRR
jgi:hypothetical protein